VIDFDEAFAGFAADALGGGVRSEEIGVIFLELGEFAEESVVFGVGDFGLVEDVVLMLVVLNART
jgi:hypothetical protein